MTAPSNRSSSLRLTPHRWSSPCCDCAGAGPSGWCRCPSLPSWCPPRWCRLPRNRSYRRRRCCWCSGRRRPRTTVGRPGDCSGPLAPLARIGRRHCAEIAPGEAGPRPDGPAPAPWPRPGHARRALSSVRPPRSPRHRRRRLPVGPVPVRSLLRRSCPPPLPTPRSIEPFLFALRATADGTSVPVHPRRCRRCSPPCRSSLASGSAFSRWWAPGHSSWRHWSSLRSSPVAMSPWPPPSRQWRSRSS